MKFIRKFFMIMLAVTTLVLISACNEDVFTLTFVTNGGTTVESLEAESGSVYTKPADPEKEGFVFAGWFEDEALTKEYSFETKASQDITLYAKWETAAENYTVKFDTDGGSTVADIVVVEGSKVTKPEDPTKDGCTFAGWFLDSSLEEEFDFTKPVTASTTLYAKWVGNVYVNAIGLPDELVLYRANKQEKTNKRTEFSDLTQEYVIGDDNAWIMKPEADFIVYNPETEFFDPINVSSWEYIITIYSYQDEEFTKVSDTTTLIDSIDTTNCGIDFSENAIGKKFKIEIYPKGLTERQLSSIEDFTISFEVNVIDGYNVYSPKELGYIENRTSGAEATAWKAFKEENDMDASFAPKNIIFHCDLKLTENDVPSYFFYQESDLATTDSDYERTLGSMKDRVDFYYHDFAANEEFHIYGNYFTIDNSSMHEVTREDGKITPEGQVISHSTLIRFQGDVTGKGSIENVNMIGNAPRVDDTLKAGGQIFIKVEGPEFLAYNNIAACLFITYMPNRTDSSFTIEKCKAYDSFNCFIYNWGSEKVYIKDSEMIGAGGPIIIQDHVESTSQDGGKIAKTFITNCNLQSYVAGSEGWFTITGAGTGVPRIKAMDAFFTPFNRAILKYTQDQLISYLNVICINKAGDAAGLTSLKIKGELKIDDLTSFDFGATDPYLAGLLDFTFANGAPAFQSSAGGYCAATDRGLFEIDFVNQKLGNQIVDPNNDIYKGQYICLYLQGMAITFEYFNAGEVYTPSN